jgi:P27 family predicted phage terminase small subunit
MAARLPIPPKDFAAPERALWARSIKALRELGVWRESDTDALERLCRASEMSRLARERIAARADGDDPESAWLSKGSMRQTITHPDVELERRARLDADKLADVLGLTPSARKRLGVVIEQDDDDDLAGDITRALTLLNGGKA